MSALAVQWAQTWRPARKLRHSPTLRLCVAHLARKADHAGYVHGQRNLDIADELERSTRTVPRLMHELIEQGVIAVEQHCVKGRGQVANVIRLLTDAIKREFEQPRFSRHMVDQFGAGALCDACGRRVIDHSVEAFSRCRGGPP